MAEAGYESAVTNLTHQIGTARYGPASNKHRQAEVLTTGYQSARVGEAVKRRLIAAGAAAAAVGLLAACGPTPSDADIAACGAALDSFKSIEDAAADDILHGQRTLSWGIHGGLGTKADRLEASAEVARGLDTSACDGVAPSFAPAVAAAADGYEQLSLSFKAAVSGASAAADHLNQDATESASESSGLMEDAALELAQTHFQYGSF